MKKFSVHPEICECATIKEFVESFQLNEDDLMLINKFTYHDFMQDLALPCQCIFYEDYTQGEPSDAVVTHMLQDIKDKKMKRVIGIGGGSVLDTAKLLCIKDAVSADDIYEDKIPFIRDKGLILIPTTCGTGCEMTCVSVIDRPKHNAKMGKRIECNFADHAVEIPELLSKIPHSVFAFSAIDALVHSMEIYVNPLSGTYNKVFCVEAIRLLIKNFKFVAENGPESKFDVMDEFLLASSYAGIALSNDICGAVHACAMQFGGQHHVSHGEANYRFLVPVFSVYADLNPKGREINALAGIIQRQMGIETDLAGTFVALDEMLNKITPRKKLREYGVDGERLMDYVTKVYATQQRLLIANYVKMTEKEFVEIYRRAY